MVGSAPGDQGARADDDLALDPGIDAEAVASEPVLERVGNQRGVISGLDRSLPDLVVESLRQMMEDLVGKFRRELDRRLGIVAEMPHDGGVSPGCHGAVCPPAAPSRPKALRVDPNTCSF